MIFLKMQQNNSFMMLDVENNFHFPEHAVDEFQLNVVNEQYTQYKVHLLD